MIGFMAAGLKRTSSDFFISAGITESAANTFTEETLTLPLDSLSREVFVVTGIIFNPGTPSRVVGTETGTSVQLTRNTTNQMQTLADFNIIALANESILSGTAELFAYDKAYGTQILESGKDYLDVIATPNMYFAIQGSNNVAAVSGQVRIYGYRAVADVSTYSALVASELNAGQ